MDGILQSFDKSEAIHRTALLDIKKCIELQMKRICCPLIAPLTPHARVANPSPINNIQFIYCKTTILRLRALMKLAVIYWAWLFIDEIGRYLLGLVIWLLIGLGFHHSSIGKRPFCRHVRCIMMKSIQNKYLTAWE